MENLLVIVIIYFVGRYIAKAVTQAKKQGTNPAAEQKLNPVEPELTRKDIFKAYFGGENDVERSPFDPHYEAHYTEGQKLLWGSLPAETKTSTSDSLENTSAVYEPYQTSSAANYPTHTAMQTTIIQKEEASDHAAGKVIPMVFEADDIVRGIIMSEILRRPRFIKRR